MGTYPALLQGMKITEVTKIHVVFAFMEFKSFLLVGKTEFLKPSKQKNWIFFDMI
jgi:hypothetical protein